MVNPTVKVEPVPFIAIKMVIRMLGQEFKTLECQIKQTLNIIKEAQVEYQTITAEPAVQVQALIYNIIGTSKVYISVKTRNSC